MNFRTKLKIRFLLASLWIVLGVGMIVTAFVVKVENEYLSTLGFSLALVGVVRLRQYFLISKNEETLKRREIIENDERNVSLMHKSRSMAFIIYIIIACLAVIVLSVLKMQDFAKLVLFSICLLVVIYWISYFVYQKKS